MRVLSREDESSNHNHVRLDLIEINVVRPECLPPIATIFFASDIKALAPAIRAAGRQGDVDLRR